MDAETDPAAVKALASAVIAAAVTDATSTPRTDAGRRDREDALAFLLDPRGPADRAVDCAARRRCRLAALAAAPASRMATAGAFVIVSRSGRLREPCGLSANQGRRPQACR